MEVFEQSTRTVLDGLLGGYNCSVFAYGATGAGKTHTMLGKESNPGVIYHTMIHLYRHIAELSSEKTCDVAVSYLEVYNEQIIIKLVSLYRACLFTSRAVQRSCYTCCTLGTRTAPSTLLMPMQNPHAPMPSSRYL
ncbi:hypothetical protein ACOMHN_011978 [Nucella lapillus]